MESQSQNPEYRINPVNFHPRGCKIAILILSVCLNMCYGCSKDPSH